MPFDDRLYLGNVGKGTRQFYTVAIHVWFEQKSLFLTCSGYADARCYGNSFRSTLVEITSFFSIVCWPEMLNLRLNRIFIEMRPILLTLCDQSTNFQNTPRILWNEIKARSYGAIILYHVWNCAIDYIY